MGRVGRYAVGIIAFALVVVCGCGGHNTNTSSPGESASGILHEPTGGVVGFAFLPPMAPDPGPAASFNADLAEDLRVDVCPLAEDGTVGAPVVTLPDTPPSSSADETIRASVDDGHYIVNLHTDVHDLIDGTIYRIFVRRGDGAEYGYSDVQLFTTMKEAKSLTDDTVFALLDGRTLPIKFRIGDGTNPWMRKIAFMANWPGNFEIYMMGEDGSDPTRLTFDPALDYRVVWSPDGRRLAFVSWRGDTRSNIWVINPDGTGLAQITSYERQDDWPCWSPDSQKILFARSTPDDAGHRWQLWAVNADGSDEHQLTDGPDAAFWPDWSPDGERIAFVRNNTTNLTDIWVMDADGTNRVNITQTPLESELNPRWSPDGSQIVFSPPVPGEPYNYDVCLMDADGGNRRRLTSSFAQEGGPSWSPDGTRILFHSNHAAGNNQSIEFNLYTMALTGGDIRQITTHEAGEIGGEWR